MDLVPGADDLVARLGTWAATARVDEAAAARSRERWLRRVADEQATFTGVLIDLAERGTPVTVTGVGGRRHRGTVRAVGTGLLVLATDSGDVLLTNAGMAAVRPDRDAPPVTGDRTITLELGIVEALAAVVGDRPRVVVVTVADGGKLVGELRSVGQDVVTLRLDGGATVYVAASAIAEVTFSFR